MDSVDTSLEAIRARLEEEALSSIKRCPTCRKLRQVRHMIHVDKYVPRSESGYYCPKHAKKIIRKYLRVCRNCGKRFTERYYGSENIFCPDCKTRITPQDKSRLSYHLRRAKEINEPATLTIDEWKENLEHFQSKCAYCGKEYEVLEHFIPIGQGKGTTKNNCVPSCWCCNIRKRNKDPFSETIPGILKSTILRVGEYLSSR